MRTANQKLKVSFALQNMNQSAQLQSFQKDKNQQKIATISIINIDSHQHPPPKKSQKNRKNIMFSTLVGPHKKQRTKGLQSLIQATIKFSDKQKSTIKSKSQRSKPLLVKNGSSFSQRLNSASKIRRQVSEQTTYMLKQPKSKVEIFDQMDCQTSKRKNECSLYHGNEILIKQDSSLIVKNGKHQDSPQQGYQKRKSYTQPSVLLDNDSYVIQNYVKWQKDEVITKLKEILKNKQSRKHIHRVLRQTSQTISRHKPKIKNIQISKEVIQPSGISQIQNLSPLHYTLTKNKIKHFCLSNLKIFNSPYLNNQEDLKIQAKAAEIINSFSKESQERAIIDIYKNRPDHCNYKTKKTQCSFQIKQYNLKEHDLSSLKKRWKPTKQKQISHFNAQKQRTNLFRELTPWHEDELQ